MIIITQFYVNLVFTQSYDSIRMKLHHLQIIFNNFVYYYVRLTDGSNCYDKKEESYDASHASVFEYVLLALEQLEID